MRTRYVVIERKYIGEIMRGERTTIPTIDPSAPGALIAVKVGHHRKPTCLLRVVACDPEPGGHVLTVRLAPNEHEPLLLAADSSRGYTNDPRLALKGEPEAIHVDMLDPRWERRSIHRRRQAREAFTVEQRMVYAQRQAALRSIDLRSEFRLLRHMREQGRDDDAVSELRRVESRVYRDAA